MAQYVFLIDSATPTLGPQADPSQYEVIFEATGDVPVFWLMLFDAADVRADDGSDGAGADAHRALYATAKVTTALHRARARRDTLLATIGTEFAEAYDLFLARLDRFGGSYVIVDAEDQIDMGLTAEDLATAIAGVNATIPTRWLPSGFEDPDRPLWLRIGMVSGWGGKDWPPGNRDEEDVAAKKAARAAGVVRALEWVVPGIGGALCVAVWIATDSALLTALAAVPLTVAAILFINWFERRRK